MLTGLRQRSLFDPSVGMIATCNDVYVIIPMSILTFFAYDMLHSIVNEQGKPCVSYIAVTIDSNYDLNIYTSKGRPTKVAKSLPGRKRKQQLSKLKKEMSYEE